LRHEITHCLGFGHKATSTTIFSGEQLKGHFVISGLNWKEGDPYEFSEDTIHGIDTVYDIDTKFAVSGSSIAACSVCYNLNLILVFVQKIFYSLS